MADKPFVHTVHTTFHMHTTHEAIRDVVDRFKELRRALLKDEGMAILKVGLNTRRSRHPKSKSLKRVHMIQIVAFNNQEAFERFREHPIHLEIKEKLKYHADWDSGDLDLTAAGFESLRAIQDL